MVCDCCKMTVASELNKMGIIYSNLELGEVHVLKRISTAQRSELKKSLHEYGLELMIDRKAILVEKIVTTIIKMIHHSEEVPNTNFSVFLTNKLNQDYRTLSNLFSKTKGVTIEHFIILHKVERIKELMTYDELSLSEISYKLNYCSSAHLSRQFKKITGLTPTFFKGIKNKKRISLESI